MLSYLRYINAMIGRVSNFGTLKRKSVSGWERIVCGFAEVHPLAVRLKSAVGLDGLIHVKDIKAAHILYVNAGWYRGFYSSLVVVR